MSDPKHTPGPWLCESGITDVYDSEHGSTICEIYKSVANTDEAQANRRLIASAPEMIEMLERLVDNDSGCFGGNYKWNRLIEEAEALIEKAKGEKTS